mgnify:CR=1 FL=1
MYRLYVGVLGICCGWGAAVATPSKVVTAPTFQGKQLLIFDVGTKTILHAQSEEELMHPSSMTKIMTAMVVQDWIEKGRIQPDQRFIISKNAAAAPGSRMFLEVGSLVSVKDLLMGLIVCSGNDAAVALAEGIAGTEDEFARVMTRRAQDLGAKNTTFMNASGLTHPQHQSTCKDLALISVHLMETYPHLAKLHSQLSFTHSKIRQSNRNPLLRISDPSITYDGLKTGYTDAGGYGLVGTGMENQQRVIFVANGWESEQIRQRESPNLITWALRTFERKEVLDTQTPVVLIPVKGGRSTLVPLYAQSPVNLALPWGRQSSIKMRVSCQGYLEAPFSTQTLGGKIEITTPLTTVTIPLVTHKAQRSAFWLWRPFLYLYQRFFMKKAQLSKSTTNMTLNEA